MSSQSFEVPSGSYTMTHEGYKELFSNLNNNRVWCTGERKECFILSIVRFLENHETFESQLMKLILEFVNWRCYPQGITGAYCDMSLKAEFCFYSLRV